MKHLLFVLLAFSCTAFAGNDNSNGGCQGNCSGTGTTNNQGGNGYGGTGFGGAGGDAAATGIGVGVGVGLGGEGGKGGAGGDGGNASAVGLGGNGGAGGAVVGSGNSNNRNDATAISGSMSGAHQSQGQSSTNVLGQSTDASSQNDNRSSAAGNTTSTNVSYRSERNAPPVYLGNVAATVSCAGGFSAGSSSQGGAGALGFNWISPDCKTVVAGQNLQSLGMVDVACRVFKTTDGFKRAAKRDPSLNAVDCSIAK